MFDPLNDAREEVIRLGQLLAKIADDIEVIDVEASNRLSDALDIVDEAIDILNERR